MVMARRNKTFAASTYSQRGVVLYVALIILVLLALLGIVGMRVSNLEEKMSAGYRDANVAFQNAEATARETECYIEGIVNRESPGCTAVAISKDCDDGFDASTWAQERSVDQSPVVVAREITRCVTGGSLVKGAGPVSEEANPIYEVTVYSVNDADNPSADAAVDTIYRP